MDDWKHIVAANLSALRKEKALTQAQLAEQLHYSDKAVSKWERGESLPDLMVMKQLADFYGITVDDFLYTPEQRAERLAAQEALCAVSEQESASDEPEQPAKSEADADDLTAAKRRNMNRLIIAGMAAVLVWLIASLIFVVLDTVLPELKYSSFLFIYAAPITAVVVLVFNSVWFNRRWNYAIISFLVWSVLGSLYMTFMLFGFRIWKIFLVGIPAQLIIVLWSRLKPAESRSEIKK